MYSRNNVEKGWGPNKTTKITHKNDYKNESRERERMSLGERFNCTFYNLIWKPITQYPLTLVDYQYRVGKNHVYHSFIIDGIVIQNLGHEGKHARGIIWKGWRILKMSLIVFARHDDDMFYDSYGNTILFYLIIPDRNIVDFNK